MTTVYKIDATGKTIGRVASMAARALRGKETASFVKNTVPNVKVQIVNASKTEIAQKKMKGKVYLRYSGYPGGQTATKLEEMISKKGFAGVYEHAVWGMIPGNTLRKKIMKNLEVKE